MSDDNNVFRFGAINGGKDDMDKDSKATLPVNDFTIVDIDDMAWDASGFLVFTAAHIAVMKETPQGVMPVLVVPLNRVKAAIHDDGLDDDETPF